jgi:hypothetical protein
MKPVYTKLLFVISLLAIVATFFAQPIPQNQAYHHFADENAFFDVPNFWNVFSNLPFVVFGLYGLLLCIKAKQKTEISSGCLFFFIGITLTGFGSAYYHWTPNDATLIWDRLPMTISFMSFFSVVISVFIEKKFGGKVLLPFLLIGLASILYWVVFDDLRVYLLVQFLPILLLVLILLFSHQNTSFKRYFVCVFIVYFLAKLLETYDFKVFEVTNQLISGHSLKHLSASMAALFFISFMKHYLSDQNQ